MGSNAQVFCRRCCRETGGCGRCPKSRPVCDLRKQPPPLPIQVPPRVMHTSQPPPGNHGDSGDTRNSQGLLGDWDHYAVLDEIPPGNFVEMIRITKDGILEGISDELGELQFSVMELEDARNQIPRESRPLSFLRSLLETWITTEPGRRPTDPERRIRQIMPEPVHDAVPSRTQVPASTGARLGQLGRQTNGIGYLPGLEPPPGVVVPVLPLQVGQVSSTGAGAPITPGCGSDARWPYHWTAVLATIRYFHSP